MREEERERRRKGLHRTPAFYSRLHGQLLWQHDFAFLLTCSLWSILHSLSRNATPLRLTWRRVFNPSLPLRRYGFLLTTPTEEKSHWVLKVSACSTRLCNPAEWRYWLVTGLCIIQKGWTWTDLCTPRSFIAIFFFLTAATCHSATPFESHFPRSV